MKLAKGEIKRRERLVNRLVKSSLSIKLDFNVNNQLNEKMDECAEMYNFWLDHSCTVSPGTVAHFKDMLDRKLDTLIVLNETLRSHKIILN